MRAPFGPFSCCNMYTVTYSAGMIDSGNVELIIGAKKTLKKEFRFSIMYIRIY